MKNKFILLMVLSAISMLIMNIEVTSVYIVLQPIQHALYIPKSQIAWIVNLYLISFAGFIIIAGKLGDRFGHRRILSLGLIIFGITCLSAGLTNTAWILFLSRAIQGLGAACIWPCTAAIILNQSPRDKQHLAIGLISGLVGLSLAIGPLIGGFFVEYLSWRWLFISTAPVCLIVSILFIIFIPNIKTNTHQKIDLLGVFLIMFCLGLLAFGINQFPLKNWHIISALCLIASMLCITLFLRRQNSVTYPIIPNEILKNKQFILACFLRLLSVMPFYILLFVIPLYLANYLHLKAMNNGLLFLPMMLVIAIFSPIISKFITKKNASSVFQLGVICYVISLGLIMLFMTNKNMLFISLFLVIFGIAFAKVSPASLTMSMAQVDEKNKGSASGMFYMMSLIGGLIAVCVCQFILEFFKLHELISIYYYIFSTSLIVCLISLLLSMAKVKGAIKGANIDI